MKKVALVFVVAVIVPSLVLAWLAVRSLRDEQLVLERQQSLLYQGVADALAREAGNYLADRQHEFAQQVEGMLADRKSYDIPRAFDDGIRTNWPLADVGFVVSLDGVISCPQPNSRRAAQTFYLDYAKFLANREPVEVFWNAGNGGRNFDGGNASSSFPSVDNNLNKQVVANGNVAANNQAFANANQPGLSQSAPADNAGANLKNVYPTKSTKLRSVMPQQGAQSSQNDNELAQYSKVSSAEAEFRQLIGDSTEGTVARFLDNKLNVLLWYRSPNAPGLIFGAEISLPKLKSGLKEIVQHLDPALQNEAAVALLDDDARPVAVSRANFQAMWKHPFVATEIGEALPHWEMAVYMIDPARLTKSACVLIWTLGLLIAALVLAIGVGSWLIFSDVNRHLTLARQKTDFVSNVSHELKTPLTSIRMFSELLAEGRVTDTAKQRSYLNIITAEAARLTRLINNVLDFARLERGEKKYNLQNCDLAILVRETVESYRPHLESNGFKLDCALPESPVRVNGDRDALAQIVVNLVSNAEKYAGERKEILVQLERIQEPLPHAEVRILDCGVGVPRGCEEKIFEQFFRAHDSLASGIQGSGLGLTLARQIARAHGGDVVYRPRPEGGSCFILRVPASAES